MVAAAGACVMGRQASGGLPALRGALGYLSSPRDAETGPSDEFPVVGSRTPFEVVPFYGPGCPDSAELPSSSAASSTTYSFAAINPALRDSLTDLELQGLTKQSQVSMEARATWSSNPFLLPSGRRTGAQAQEALDREHRTGMVDIFSSSLSGESSGKEAGAMDAAKIASGAFAGFVPARLPSGRFPAEDFFNSCSDLHTAQQDAFESSADIFATAESMSDARTLSRSGSMPHACPAALLYQQAAPVREVPPKGGPMLSFWDVDSRGSTGLNFVFVDDGSVREAGPWVGDGAMTSASTTIDSAGLSTADMQLVLSNAMSPRGDNAKVPALCYSLELDACMPFYDNTTPAPVKDGPGGGYVAGPYNVSFDFVSNSFSTDLECAMARQASGGLLQVTAAQPTAPELLSNFLRSTNGDCAEQLLAAARKEGGGVQGRLVSTMLPASGYLDMPSRDNMSRSFSDSECSGGPSWSRPGVAVLQNKAFDGGQLQGPGSGVRSGSQSAAEEDGRADDGDKPGAGCPAVESLDSVAKAAPMTRRSTESRRSLLSPEIEAAHEEAGSSDDGDGDGDGGGAPIGRHLYDSSRSWVSRLSSRRLRQGCIGFRPESPRKKPQQGRSAGALGRVLGKWVGCFKPAGGRLMAT